MKRERKYMQICPPNGINTNEQFKDSGTHTKSIKQLTRPTKGTTIREKTLISVPASVPNR